jgi:hypothetical protein
MTDTCLEEKGVMTVKMSRVVWMMVFSVLLGFSMAGIVAAQVPPPVTAVTATAPLVSSGGTTPNVSLPGVIIGPNTAIGSGALPSNTGTSNTASGSQALFSNTTGNNNTASGFVALRDNTTGSNNTASGELFVLFGVFLPQLQGIIGQRDPVLGSPAEKTVAPPLVALKKNDDTQHASTEIPQASDNTHVPEVLNRRSEVTKNASPAGTLAGEPEKNAIGQITLRYLGDFAACGLDLQVRIGDKMVQPTSNSYPVSGVPLGATTYSINGAIACPLIGNCAASGSGNIDVEDRSAYNVVWQNVGIGICRVVLIKSP